jgi:hypothetical protein
MFEHPAYVRACAEHEGVDPMVLEGPASIALLRDQHGLHTVYGYPQPFGDTSQRALAQLARSLRSLGQPVRVALSPLGPGPKLAALVRSMGAVEATRPICIVDLSDADPIKSFSASARSSVRRAHRAGVEPALIPVESWFGREYRKAMSSLGADSVYAFSDDYFRLIANLDHVLASVTDRHGLATANLFLFGPRVGTYHLSIRRPDPAPPPGVVNLAILTGLREAQRRGIQSVILGGGRGTGLDDPLFRFKQEMATRIAERETLLLGQRCESIFATRSPAS